MMPAPSDDLDHVWNLPYDLSCGDSCGLMLPTRQKTWGEPSAFCSRTVSVASHRLLRSWLPER